MPPQLREEQAAAAHFRKVEKQLFDEDDSQDEGKNSDDEDVYDQYRGKEDDALKKKKETQDRSMVSGTKQKKLQKQDLSRSPEEN